VLGRNPTSLIRDGTGGVHGALTEIGDQEEGMQQQITAIRIAVID
jgi:hypothetical protein